MKKLSAYIVAIFTLIAFCVLFFYNRDRFETATKDKDDPRDVVNAERVAVTADESAAEPKGVPLAERVIPVEEQDIGEEVRATRRMYLAHASLREPEVSDPDSVENQIVMQRMIANSIGRKEANPEPGRLKQ